MYSRRLGFLNCDIGNDSILKELYMIASDKSVMMSVYIMFYALATKLPFQRRSQVQEGYVHTTILDDRHCTYQNDPCGLV